MLPPTRLWQGQAVTLDPLQSFAYTAGAGHRVPVGLCVTLMPLKHPFQAAMEARSLAQVTGHPVVYGMGPGPVVFQEMLGARPVGRLAGIREYVTAVRDLLAEDISPDGATVVSRMPLHHMQSPPVRIGLGVLRPAMARLAGEVADVAVTWLAPAAYIGQVIEPALREGLRRHGLRARRSAALSRWPYADPAAIRTGSFWPATTVTFRGRTTRTCSAAPG